MSDFNLPAFLTFDSTSSISNPMSLEVLDPVSSEIPDSVSSIFDLLEENLHENFMRSLLTLSVIEYVEWVIFAFFRLKSL
ncbi:35538_t:CDS:2 [Racocetra persica]|uniref:35538_t:CDS:1 n=1 Tax=Racocetra persica TaxID=160502 RepID=A0ACA9KN14_9GLOM|nr:35538_t:CDS:2 [Racocetra persica]